MANNVFKMNGAGAGNDPASKITSELAEPDREWVIGFSLQLAINQHQFSLHTLGSCHLCKDERVSGWILVVCPGDVDV